MTSDLNLWRLFLELAASGSLSKTAASQNRLHSSLSRQLAVLEKECGGPLFYRTGRGVILTEMGAALLPEATSLLAQADRLSAHARAGREGLSGYVRVGMLPSLIQLAASRLAQELLTEHPGLASGWLKVPTSI